MKRALTCLMLGVLLMTVGCASMITTSMHNQNVETRANALQFQANNDGVRAAINLMQLKGYIGAWKENPWAMLGATLLDIGTGIGGYSLWHESQDDDRAQSSIPQNNVQGYDGARPTSLTVIAGAGSSVTINLDVVGDDASK